MFAIDITPMKGGVPGLKARQRANRQRHIEVPTDVKPHKARRRYANYFKRMILNRHGAADG
ncbi:MAG TPA: hypothetical protein VK604_12895 [Bryobacteraceae bacterium]|nr:hypothetical protein [Bryobacteraceae bacterium]